MRLVNFLKATYQDLILNKRKHVSFWILFSFTPTFIISRLLVYVAPELFIVVRGTHIHHLTYGIIMLAVAGFLALNIRGEKWRDELSIIYGVGLALSFDEFGMWLRLQDAYGLRLSYDAVIIILAILINIVYFSKFWKKILLYPIKLFD